MDPASYRGAKQVVPLSGVNINSLLKGKGRAFRRISQKCYEARKLAFAFIGKLTD